MPTRTKRNQKKQTTKTNDPDFVALTSQPIVVPAGNMRIGIVLMNAVGGKPVPVTVDYITFDGHDLSLKIHVGNDYAEDIRLETPQPKTAQRRRGSR